MDDISLGVDTRVDPNAMYGSTGYGSAGYVSANSLFPYLIDFENAPTATAPAQRVVITDQLDPNLDWSTLQLTGVGFGDTNISSRRIASITRRPCR